MRCCISRHRRPCGALGSNFTFTTDAGDLDLLGWVEPLGGYDDIVDRCETMRIGETDVKVISLDDLILIKKHIGRPKDRDSLMHLLAIKRVRDGEANRDIGKKRE